jgi:hypothetical protein
MAIKNKMPRISCLITEYYDYCKDNGLLKAESWEDWLQKGEQSSVVEYPGLTKEEIDEAVDRGLKRFYFRPTYMIKFLLKTRDLSDLNRRIRGAKNFVGYLGLKKQGEKT